MKIAIGADHGGFELKEQIKSILAGRKIDVEDVGCFDKDSVDYPDYANQVARRVDTGESDEGILVCTTGLGMDMAANKYAGVRSALCLSPDMAGKARSHNDANVLALGAAYVKADEVQAILDAWLDTKFSHVERHQRRVGKITASARELSEYGALEESDPELAAAIRSELAVEQGSINLIASENYASRAVRQAQGSLMTNKYAEGYPRKRWYNGCASVDQAEQLAIDRARQLFGAEHANVQPHCGSSANMAVYFAVLEPGDTILAMSLAHGGHLTHGHAVNFSGRLFNIVGYGVDEKTERIDYDIMEALAVQHRPKLIVAGASAYSRTLDFAKFRDIADKVGALLMVDMAHIAGLVAGESHPSPVPYADFVTSTTHKTLRGPRSGMILCKEKFAKDIDRQVFPGLQGGPLMHVIAAKAVCFHEALQPEFKAYTEQVVRNAKVMATTFEQHGMRLVSGGTDNHLMLLDVAHQGLTGKDAANALEKVGLIVNKNTIPFEKNSPFVTSGIRVGTPALTTRGMRDAEAGQVAEMIAAVLADIDNSEVADRVRLQVSELAARFPTP